MLEILKRNRLRGYPPASTQPNEGENTVDVTVRNLLSGKFTNFFKVDPQLGAILRAAGIAEPYVKPTPAVAAARVWAEASTHTGKMGIHYRKAGGEVATTYNAEVTKEVLEASWNVVIPEAVWATFAARR